MKKFLLIGDVVDSRSQDTKKLWKKFNKVINKSHKEVPCVYPAQITLGDEFQAVVEGEVQGLELSKWIQEQMKPFSMRFVMVAFYGDLALVKKVPSHYNPLNTPEMMLAQKLMKQLKKEKKKWHFQKFVKQSTREKYLTLCALDYTDPSSFEIFENNP